MKKQKNQNKTEIHLILIFCLVTLVTAGTIFSLMLASNESSDSSPETEFPDSNVDYNSPPQTKEDPAKGISTDQPNQDSDNSENVSVIITYAGITDSQVSASGMIDSIVEANGTCIYIFTSPTGETTPYTSEPLQNANSTICASVNINQDKFSSGNWSVVLKYQSPKSKGESPSVSFKIS